MLRCDPSPSEALSRTLDAARRAGWAEVWIRAHGGRFTDPAHAARLRASGVRGVIAPVFSHASAAHDAVAGKAGALVTTLRAMRMLADAGLALGAEVPLLEARLQDLEAIVSLGRRATESFTQVGFFVPRRPMPGPLGPPRWSALRPRLAAAIRKADELGVTATFAVSDGIPPCVLGHDPEFAPRALSVSSTLSRRPDGFALTPACRGCALIDRCPGPALAYHAAHHDADVEPFAKRPRTSAGRAWLPHQREAAQHVTNWVLRPTVNCNQDCSFCSANETSENVLAPELMYRRIARAARKGVKYLSFGGGEPTLSKDLVHYIRVASRLGIEDVELVTNAVLIDSPEKVRPLVDAGLNRAFVSLHGHDELVSSRATSKLGDWERTVRGVDALLDAGVRVDLNHVISSINYPYLPRFAEFVIARWGGALGVSFAFVTPQFKALESADLVPRISDVIPYLRRAMRAFVERGHLFTVGSRQGIPPCFLGEFVNWSDFAHMTARAHSEDEPQKVRGPRCDACRFSPQCVGVWKPYAARYGFDELVPVPGETLTAEQIKTILMPFPPRGFDEVHAFLRQPVREDAPVAMAPEPARVRLPVVSPASTSVLRVVMVGVGAQAQRLSRAMSSVAGMRLVGISSPHVEDRDTTAFGEVDRDADLARLVARVRPDALVVASATTAHHAHARLALSLGVPALIEKPFTRTLEQADELVAHPGASALMVAHTMRFSPGFVALRRELDVEGGAPLRRVSFVRRTTLRSPDAPATWTREALLETLYHGVYLLSALAGGGIAEVLRAEARKTSWPEWLRVTLAYPSGAEAEFTLDCTASDEGLEVSGARQRGRAVTWVREGAEEALVRETDAGDRTHSVERGSDSVAMLDAFRNAVLERGASPVPAREGADVLRTVHAMLDALAPYIARPGAPKHVASRPLRG